MQKLSTSQCPTLIPCRYFWRILPIVKRYGLDRWDMTSLLWQTRIPPLYPIQFPSLFKEPFTVHWHKQMADSNPWREYGWLLFLKSLWTRTTRLVYNVLLETILYLLEWLLFIRVVPIDYVPVSVHRLPCPLVRVVFRWTCILRATVFGDKKSHVCSGPAYIHHYTVHSHQ
jgi:hypothetical protein